MAWDLSFKNILKLKLGEKGIKVDVGVELSVSNQQIDFMIQDLKTKPFPFQRAKLFLIGEFKSNRDKVSAGNFNDLAGKFFTYISTTHGYGKKSKVNLKLNHHHGSCVMILGGKLNIPKIIRQEFNLKEREPGIYEGDGKNLPHFLVLKIDDLTKNEDTYWLGLFGSQKSIEQTFERSIQNDDSFINSIGYFLYGEKLLTIANKLDRPIDPMSLNIKAAVETIGIKRVAEEIGIKQIINEIGWNAFFDVLQLEKTEIKENLLIDLLSNISNEMRPSNELKRKVLLILFPEFTEEDLKNLLGE
ncbi:MAG: hypothetical protein D6732_22755 [Methanobacteriota archaeon]|nr:MAG: hypothetical protein D6732_22755 [Euryarchaeota archaeon]